MIVSTLLYRLVPAQEPKQKASPVIDPVLASKGFISRHRAEPIQIDSILDDVGIRRDEPFARGELRKPNG